MKNIGPKSRQWLESVGVNSLEDISRLGVVQTYKLVKSAYPEKISLNLLYGLQAALMDIPWNLLSDEIKQDLIRQTEES